MYAPRLLPMLIYDNNANQSAITVVTGPFCLVIGEVFVPGIVIGDVFTAGLVTGQESCK